MGAQNRTPRPRPHSGAQYSHASRLPAFVNGYRSLIISPVNGALTRDKRPDITVLAEAVGGGTVDIQIEWRATQSGPVSYVTQFAGSVSGSPQVLEPPSDLALYNWYYRARAGSISGNIWSAWTGTQYLTVYPLPGFAHAYSDFNIGVENIDPVRSITTYADLNIGLAQFDETDGFMYADFNVGLEQKPRLGAEYLDLNVTPVLGPYEPSTYMDVAVTSGVPTPHIWYVQPQIGPQGLMFRIAGQGFGVSQGEFNGKVKLGELECPILSWSAIPDNTAQVVRISRTSMGDTSGFNFSLKPNNGFGGSNAYVFASGDTLEYEYRRLSPGTYTPDEFFWRPFFQLINSGGALSSPNYVWWNDEYGNIASRPDVPVGQVIKRSFPVPAVFYGQSTQRGTNWGWTYSGVRTPERPAHSVEIRNMMIRGADGVPKLWILGEDGSAISLPDGSDVVVAPGIASPSFDAFIEYGATNKAHQEILALVPDGAESGMVQVILEVP